MVATLELDIQTRANPPSEEEIRREKQQQLQALNDLRKALAKVERSGSGESGSPKAERFSWARGV